jgi:hypothetical protein
LEPLPVQPGLGKLVKEVVRKSYAFVSDYRSHGVEKMNLFEIEHGLLILLESWIDGGVTVIVVHRR